MGAETDAPPAFDPACQYRAGVVCAGREQQRHLTRTEADIRKRVAHLVRSIPAVDRIAKAQFALIVVPSYYKGASQFILSRRGSGTPCWNTE